MRCGVFKAVLALEFSGYGLAQHGVARHGGIVGEIVVDCLYGCFLYVFGSIEVRLSYT